ncbi:unnamed protein product [Paramecium octaurelia]|uniref:Uncharacterized protein n=1 Tax=Paramecium octaurelia TaxID=43137 RepID=A0A8S1X9W0_PAROT|nr:unnamed protein product [Paramecium octaurelia]
MHDSVELKAFQIVNTSSIIFQVKTQSYILMKFRNITNLLLQTAFVYLEQRVSTIQEKKIYTCQIRIEQGDERNAKQYSSIQDAIIVTQCALFLS